MYPKNNLMHHGFRVIRDTSAYGAQKLCGLRDTTIYTTYSSYIKMSNEFRKTCTERNIEVKVIT